VRRIIAIVAIAILVTACSTASRANSNSSPGPKATELTIYAAASLKGALEAARTAYEAATPGTTITLAIDASSTLRTQIEQGAPADLFLSADERNPAALVDAGLSDGAAVDFAGNAVVLIVPPTNPAGIDTPADLAVPGIKIVAAGADVPITRYATQAVAALALEPGYPADLAARYDANVVSREDNVKAVVAKIELGEGDAAIVYATDARASAKVRTIPIPPTSGVPVAYAGVVLKSSAETAAGHAFLGWLVGPAGQAVLSRFGFLPPS
jgi:molybdate transport system substrate-binding protein